MRIDALFPVTTYVMRIARLLLTVACCAAASAAFADASQVCKDANGIFVPGDTPITISPSNPDSNQTIDIGVGLFGLAPVSTMAVLHGDAIDVTMTGVVTFADLHPPPACISATVGPLAPGTYNINFYVISDNTYLPPGPQFVRSTAVTVGATNDPRSCFAPTQAKPVCASNPGCIFVCPNTPVSSAKLNLTIALNQLPAGACVKTLQQTVTDNSIGISGKYAACDGEPAAQGTASYLYPSFQPLRAGHYAVSVSLVPDPGYTSTPPAGPIVLNSAVDVSASPSTLPNYQGLWWAAPAGSQPGWGINVAHQGNLLFLSWFTFDLHGKAHWYVGAVNAKFPGLYAGRLYDVVGPAFDTLPFPSIGATGGATSVFESPYLSVRFTDENNGYFQAFLDFGVTYSEMEQSITREVFGRIPNCTWGIETNLSLAPNYTDLWWASPAGSEAGWGISLAHQDDVIFATWFTFDHDHTPMWLVLQANKIADRSYAGTLIKATSGPPIGTNPFPAIGTSGGAIGEIVGTGSFVFTDGNAGNFTYAVNGVTQSKSITREVFAGTGTVCQ